MQFLLFFAFPPRRKRGNWVILRFAYERRSVFTVFCSSLTSETLFFSFFAFRLRAKASFQCFLLFACKRNVVFRVFCISLASESQFSSIFDFLSREKCSFSSISRLPAADFLSVSTFRQAMRGCSGLIIAEVAEGLRDVSRLPVTDIGHTHIVFMEV